MRLYHGTTKANAAAIRAAGGLLPGSWLTTSEEFAGHYAQVKAAATEDVPVVMTFDLDAAELTAGGLQTALVKEFIFRLPGTMPGTKFGNQPGTAAGQAADASDNGR